MPDFLYFCNAEPRREWCPIGARGPCEKQETKRLLLRDHRESCSSGHVRVEGETILYE